MSNEPKSENTAVEAQTTIGESNREHPNESSVQTEQDRIKNSTNDTTAPQGDEEAPPADGEVTPRPLRRRDHACNCVRCIVLLLIVLAAIGAGLIAWGVQGCFKAENRKTPKCQGKGRRSKSDGSSLSVKGSLGTYLVAFAFEVMLLMMF